MKKRLLSIVTLMSFFISGWTQVRKLTGTVITKANVPLESVSLKFMGTTVGGQTDKNGKFTLNMPGKGKVTLLVTHIGYKSLTKEITSETEVTLTMQDDENKTLDEVVVVNIGYSSVAKSKLAGSISSISEKDLKDFPVSSVAEALAGKLAGVSVTTSEGSPGADIKITVRGGTSLTQDNSPLYIVDGVQLDNALSILSPDEIKSIDVLKDVASTSIYGARGANGVVLITTKAGKKGRAVISFNTYAGKRKITNEISVMNPYDFVKYQYELNHLHYNGYELIDTSNSFAKKYGAYNDLDIYKSVPMVDWQSRVFGRNAASSSQVLSMSGGGEGTNYYATLNNYKENGIMVNSGLKRTLGSFRFENKITNDLKVGINVRYSQQTINGAGTSNTGSSANNTLKNVVRFQPYNGLINVEDVDASDSYDLSINLSNPLTAALNAIKYNTTKILFTNGTLSYTIIPKLTFSTVLGYTITDKKVNSFQGLTNYQVASTNGGVGGQYSNMPFITLSNVSGISVSNTNTINFRPLTSSSKTLDILIGEETIQNDGTNYDQTIKYLPASVTPDQAFANVQQANPPAGGIQAAPISSSSGDRIISFFARGMYSIKGRYNLNFAIRRDGSSKFLPENRWGTFPSAQFSWKLSDERILQKLDLKWLGYLKMRVSYGSAGNNRINGNNLGETTFSNSVTSAGYAVGDASMYTGLFSPILANPKLKWETIVSRNIGFDMELFQGRLSVSIDGYINHTKDLLLNSNIPQQTGYITQYQNVGKTKNEGVELQLSGAVVKRKNFGYNASFNISFNKNTIVELQGDVKSYKVSSGWGTNGEDFLVQVGAPVGQYYGYVSDGFYSLNDFDRTQSNAVTSTWKLKKGVADASSILGQKVIPGVMKLKKLVDSKTDSIVSPNDRTVLGNNQPLFYGGFNNQFSFKGFDMGIFINFSYGSKTYNANSIEYTSAYKATGNNMLSKVVNRWQTFDANGNFMHDWDQIAAANKNAKTYAPTRGNYILRSDAIEDGSFIRITNVSLGYTFPKKTLQKMPFSTLRVYTTINNLYTLTNYTGFDPEASTRNNPLTPGVDYSAYPRNRYFLIGLNVVF